MKSTKTITTVTLLFVGMNCLATFESTALAGEGKGRPSGRIAAKEAERAKALAVLHQLANPSSAKAPGVSVNGPTKISPPQPEGGVGNAEAQGDAFRGNLHFHQVTDYVIQDGYRRELDRRKAGYAPRRFESPIDRHWGN
jgi:hypothetical protein